MLGFPLGLLSANVGEWLIHKYVLHEQGKRDDAFYSSHWRQHHRDARRFEGRDPLYDDVFTQHAPRLREVLGLVGIGVAVAPLAPIAPFFCLGVWTHEVAYYWVHKTAHRDPDWMREHLPWHYDHHMGRDQHANWCVVHPLADYLFGTRVKWAGTPDEQAALERARARQARRVTAVADESTPTDGVASAAVAM